MTIIRSYISGTGRTFVLNKDASYESIMEFLNNKEGTQSGVLLYSEGRPVYPGYIIAKHTPLVATLTLAGGKGGFGSMLRAIGAQIEKTTNREACRDLSGRRLRDINEEKRLKEYLATRKDRRREQEEKRKQKLEKLKEQPKHIFEDKTYFEQREKQEKDIHDSVELAFAKASKSTNKRPNVEPTHPAKKSKLLLNDDLDVSSDESDNENPSNDSHETTSDDFCEVNSDSNKSPDVNEDEIKNNTSKSINTDDTEKNDDGEKLDTEPHSLLSENKN